MKFKVGDLVRLTNFANYPISSVKIGEIGIIKEVHLGKAFPYTVKFETYTTGISESELQHLTKLEQVLR